ncbi:DEAD/DEAH box helicase [Rhodococcus sp. Q]|uniref:DEAD/DEAH box helicase n=1 Tax=Rhodococcus sp. Q TaxID=2502252 RepID=UPI0010F4B0B4|nr:DEAD/DEAH box helicase [Rhodococcus sp. Q]
MGAESTAKADIVAFWRAIELFSPQTVPRIDRFDTLSPVEDVTDPRVRLPWEPGHDQQKRPIRLGFERRHVVYVGVYRIDEVWVAVDDILDPGTENFDPRPSGDCALAAIVVDDRGRYIRDTAIVSGLAWAAGRTRAPGPASSAWLAGFDGARDQFADLVDEVQTVDWEVGEPAPLDARALDTIRARAETMLAVTGLFRCTDIRVRTVDVRDGDGGGTDFLNSFIAADLDLVRAHVAAGDLGCGLARYLTEDADIDATARVDVHMNPAASLDGCRPDATPLGRWPSNPDHPLALGQQFAVNAITRELGSRAGIFAVNGPPGTGKSTLLRDLVAGIVVERANRLADLTRPEAAFTGTPHRWKNGDYTRVVQRWDTAFHGFEIVVASSNNGAVENISHEMPDATAIDGTHFEVDYFGDIATALLPDTTDTAWALTAARLGRKDYRTQFVNTLWFDEKPPRGVKADGRSMRRGIQSILKEFETATPARPWWDAVADYRAAKARVEGLVAERQRAHDTLTEHHSQRRRLAELDTQLTDATDQLTRARGTELAARSAVERAEQGRVNVTEEIARHNEIRPHWWRLVTASARVERGRWRTRRTQLDEALARWEASHRQAWDAHQESQHSLAAAEDAHEPLAREHHAVTARVDELGAAVARCRDRWGSAVPGDDWHTDPHRDLAAPWSDAEIAEARSRLFLAALALHREFLTHVPKQMRQSLHGATDVVSGSAPNTLGEDTVADAWRALFFLVPLVSTTFASFDRVFHGMGAEGLGWLLIDEAGQATPQNPVGAIWRARRTVVVGDPLQLEPVVTLPFRAQQAVRRTFGVSERWLPQPESAQSIADRLNRWGTTLSDGEKPIWVGAPLRVHRRCAEPMFSIVNAIAYDGTMIHGGNPDPDGPLPMSMWLDVTGPSSGHYVRAEHDLLLQHLDALRDVEQDMSEVIVVTPFRQVANRLAGLGNRYPGLTAGTVHKSQGKEADIVFFVLGGDPAKDGAKRWAAAKPNLANVAISRAKKRLYVIGDRESWSRHPRFDVLAAELVRHEEEVRPQFDW